jgi:mRNA interferase HicA
LKRRELERHLAAHGCEMLREGANHTIWHNPPSDLRTPVPRHREIPTGTARAIVGSVVERRAGRRLHPPRGRSTSIADMAGLLSSSAAEASSGLCAG